MNPDDNNTALDQARRRLLRLSEEALDNGQYILTEGDQWFLSALASVDRGASRTQTEVVRAGRHFVQRIDRLRPRWMRRAGPRERIQTLLESELKRAALELDADEFANFSARIGTLVELVLNGTLDLRDIGFEQDAEACPLEQPPEAP